MRRNKIIIIVLLLLFSSYVALQLQAAEIIQQGQAEEISNTTDIADDLTSLENSARDVQSAAEATLDEIQDLELWTNSNANISTGIGADILNRLDTVDSQVDDYNFRLNEIDQKLAVIYDSIGDLNQSDPETSALMNRAYNVKNIIAQTRETVNDISSIRGRIDINKLSLNIIPENL